MKFAKLCFLVLSLFVLIAGYKMLPDIFQNGSRFYAHDNSSLFTASSSFEKSPCFFDFSVDLEEDETLDLLKKSAGYTLIVLFFTSFFVFSARNESIIRAQRNLFFCRYRSLSLLQIFRV